MPRYTYTFYDIPSRKKLGSLPLYGVSASDLLLKAGGGGSAGTFTGAIRMDSDFTSRDEILSMTRPEGTAVWMDRDGTPIWCGIVWTRTYQSDGRVLQINAQTFSSYLSKVVWWPTRGSLAQIAQYDLVDNPHNVIRFLWNYLITYADLEYNVGVTLEPYHAFGDPALNPESFTTASFILQERKYLSEYVDSALTAGAEYRIRPCFDVSGERTALFESGPPLSLGVTPEAADYGESFEYPGELAKYWLTNSSANAPTRVFGVGKSTGTDDIFALKQGDTTGRIGVDTVRTYESAVLDEVDIAAATDLRTLQGDLNRPVYDVSGEYIDMGWSLGDHRRVVIYDPYRYELPMSGVVRLTGWQLTPASTGTTEQLSITIADPTVMEPLNV
jgi:hypothetical protein